MRKAARRAADHDDGADASCLSLVYPPRARESGAASRVHTLRIVEDEFDAAQPFGGLAGATHMIVYNPLRNGIELHLG